MAKSQLGMKILICAAAVDSNLTKTCFDDSSTDFGNDLSFDSESGDSFDDLG